MVSRASHDIKKSIKTVLSFSFLGFVSLGIIPRDFCFVFDRVYGYIGACSGSEPCANQLFLSESWRISTNFWCKLLFILFIMDDQ